ncbi:MAG: hypothetical protein U9Q66_02100 [Patescibacteria group bacterium]|nr:hypothetical protein [Patescibacteria group bacterium]
MKKIYLPIVVLVGISTCIASELEKDISHTRIYKDAKENNCNSYLIKADKLEKKYNKQSKYSFDMINNCIVRIELNYKKFLTCQKLKEMNK